jgi:parallel beta-helix repeat protein
MLIVTNTKDGGPGSLRYEIAHADAQTGAYKGEDTITFAPSLDGQTITLSKVELLIANNVTIQGPGAGLLTISGADSSRVFEVAANVTASLSGLTITNGDGVAVAGSSAQFDGTGGGILNQGTLAVSGCTISGNAGSSTVLTGGGGGIENLGTLAVNGCTISGNSAFDGGGIYSDGIYRLGVSGCTLTGNVASFDGGGIYGSGTVTDSTLSGNSAAVEGGGIGGNAGSPLTVSGCTLSGNSAFDGGGIAGLGTVTGCTISDNSAFDSGGGIAGNGLTVSGCTLSGNSAGSVGGGMYSAGTATVSNSVFTMNTPDNIFGPYTDGGGNTFS